MRQIPYTTRTKAAIDIDENNNTHISVKSNYNHKGVNTVSFGKESFRWLDTKIWNHLLSHEKRKFT